MMLLWIQIQQGTQATLKRLRCDTCSEMMVIWLAPNGNKANLIRELKSAANDWGEKVRMGNGFPIESWATLYINMSTRLKHPIYAFTLTGPE